MLTGIVPVNSPGGSTLQWGVERVLLVMVIRVCEGAGSAAAVPAYRLFVRLLQHRGVPARGCDATPLRHLSRPRTAATRQSCST